jgi:hypothetical protein
MPKPWYQSPLAAAVPLVLVLLLFGMQACSQKTFVLCKGRDVGCKALKVGELYEVDRSMQFDTVGRVSLPLRVNAAQDTGAAKTARLSTADSVRLEGLKIAVRRYNARLVWAFFVAMGVVAALVAFGTAALLLTRSSVENPTSRSLEGRTVPYYVRLGALLASSLVVGLVLFQIPEFHMSVMLSVLTRSIGAELQFGMARIDEVMNFFNSFEQAASFALILACCLMLLPSHATDSLDDRAPDAPADLERRLRPVLHRIGNLRIFLFVATAMLVIGILRMQAVGDWAVTFVKPTEATVLASTGTTLRGVMGAYFSLVLAAVYLPSAYVLRARAAALIAEAEVPPEVKEEAVARAGLSVSLGDAVPRVAAILAPLLAGPIGTLLQQFAG